MATTPSGVCRKRVNMAPIEESDYPPLGHVLRRKRERRLFIFGRGEEPDFPRFLVIERTDEGSLKSVSVFKVKREIHKLVGNVKKIQPLNDGKILLIEILQEAQAETILKMTSLAGKQVKVSWHEKMNKSKGVVACYGWTHIPSDELKEELKAFNISDVMAIKKKAEAGSMIDTGTFIVTFDSPNIPKEIDAWYYPLKVKLFIPNPMRCFKCQKYGHFGDKCRIRQKMCGLCLHDEHEGECVHPHYCANCGSSDHLSWSRKCEVFKQEFEIMKLKVSKKMSYFAAKQEFEAGRTADESFASVVAKTNARKILRQIQQTRTQIHQLNPDRSEEDNRQGVGYPTAEFLQSLRADQMDTDDNVPITASSPGLAQATVTSVGGSSSGASNSTGNLSPQVSPGDSQNVAVTGSIIRDALDTLN
ncbi:hypothetical protein DMENIID0001_006620 [Sergentomyia squamirostris]